MICEFNNFFKNYNKLISNEHIIHFLKYAFPTLPPTKFPAPRSDYSPTEPLPKLSAETDEGLLPVANAAPQDLDLRLPVGLRLHAIFHACSRIHVAAFPESLRASQPELKSKVKLEAVVYFF